jgi:carboxyl-terminal processing protease
MPVKPHRLGSSLALAAMLAGCGGGGGGGGGSVVTPPTSVAPTPSPTPTPVASTGCSLRERQTWAAAQLNEWYLFPETLPASLDPAPYSSVDTYIDALTATARAQNKDRYFTYLTSIAEENAYYSAGASAGFGFRLGYDTGARRVFVIESFEGTPALGAGIDRGTELVGIGTTAADIRTVSSIMAASGPSGVSAALGEDTAGLTRVFRISDASGTREVTVAKTDYALPPVSSRYGAKVIDDGGRKVGYLNLRTFINTADPALRNAFATFKAAGVTNLVIDLRYNGGGLISIAELMGDLLGANRARTDVFSYTVFRPEKSAENELRYFDPQPQSIAPARIAFIGTGGTASASELVINAFIPYLRANVALIGTNTYGKPVGQIALDKPECDDRLRVVALATQNSARQGGYYTGLVGTVEASCRANDDITRPLGDPSESSVKVALDFLAGRSCSAISNATASLDRAAVGAPAQQLLSPERPSTAQREVPGLF